MHRPRRLCERSMPVQWFQCVWLRHWHWSHRIPLNLGLHWSRCLLSEHLEYQNTQDGRFGGIDLIRCVSFHSFVLENLILFDKVSSFSSGSSDSVSWLTNGGNNRRKRPQVGTVVTVFKQQSPLPSSLSWFGYGYCIAAKKIDFLVFLLGCIDLLHLPSLSRRCFESVQFRLRRSFNWRWTNLWWISCSRRCG